ncbi:MAG TPA: hypothetical protein VFU07_01875 [Candidatus Lumbricidophila sp.]|nr:hypothetical protein [Candidatus Lumbricidophila sp.]
MVPVGAVAIVLTFLFVLLSRLDLSLADDRTATFGGRNAEIALNGYLPTTASAFDLAAAMSDVRAKSGSNVCAEIGALLRVPDRPGAVFSFREFQPSCLASDWGFRLVSGRWPTAPNEVVVTPSVRLSNGSNAVGLAPSTLSVVGQVVNDYSLRAASVIAAPGTWRSWLWPGSRSVFPDLVGGVTLYLDASSERLAEVVSELQAESPTAAAIVSLSLDRDRSTIMARMPFLYPLTAVPLAVVAAAMSVALRHRHVLERRRLLTALGMASRAASWAMSLATLIGLTVAQVAGAAVGWVVAALGTGPLVVAIAAQPPSAVPSLADPLIRGLLGVLLPWTVWAGYAALSRERRTADSDLRTTAAGLGTVRQAIAIVAIVVGFVVASTTADLTYVFVTVLLWTAAFGLVSPQIAKWVSRRMPTRRPGTRLVARRIRSGSSLTGTGMYAMALAVGPTLAIICLIGTSIATQNQSEKLPPRAGQAIYVLGQDDALNARVATLVQAATAPTPIRSTYVYAPTTPDGAGVVASSNGTGAITVVDSADDLEDLVGATIGREARQVLEAGGMLTTRSTANSTVFVQNGTAIELSGAASISASREWGNESAVYLLKATALSHGFEVKPVSIAFTEMSTRMGTAIRAALNNAGLDPGLVRNYRPGDAYAATPMQLAIAGVVGLSGLALLVGVVRGISGDLRRRSGSLILQGASPGWLARAFTLELLITIAAGVAAGMVLSVCAVGIGLMRLRTPFVIPIETIGIYLAALTSGCVLVGAAGLARIRR